MSKNYMIKNMIKMWLVKG